jgi:tRNA 2-selenouridine synthase
MSINRIEASEVLARLDQFSAVIDARTEDEYALDRLPGAVNWPTLLNEERRIVGTTYKQISAFEARKRGAAMAARNISEHIEREVLDLPRDWQPLLYCWRGGKRSGALAIILDQIGFHLHLIEGGYKAFRNAIVEDIPRRVAPLQWHVVCGPTGSGKTRLLHALAEQGAQVLDLEALAQHRASVLGAIPCVDQPSQKQFDTRIWDALRRFTPDRPVFVESESKKVGNVAIPEALVEAMRGGHCLKLELAQEERVALLLEDYAFLLHDTEFLCGRLEVLKEMRGKAAVQVWKDHVQAGRFDAMVLDLLRVHYDPGYQQSTAKNFRRYADAPSFEARDRSADAMTELAREIIARTSV